MSVNFNYPCLKTRDISQGNYKTAFKSNVREQTSGINVGNKKESIKKISFAVAIASTLLGVVLLMKGKISPKLSKNLKVITKTKPKMEMNAEAKKVYNDVASKLNRKVETSANTIEYNLKPKEKYGTWSKEDMNKYYSTLEESSAKAAKEAKEKVSKEAEIATKNVNEAEKIQQELQRKVDTTLKEFEASLEGKSIDELDEIYASFNRNEEYAKYSEIGKARRLKLEAERKQVYPRHVSDTLFLQGEDKANYDIFIGKLNIIRKQKYKLENTYYERLLKKSGDKSVDAPHSFEYLTSQEADAFGTYYDICPDNTAIRLAKGKYESGYTKLMDAGFKKAPPLKEEAVVYRAVSPTWLDPKESEAFLNFLKKGNVIKDYAYVSTASHLDSQFKQFASNVKPGKGALMRIRLPKGTQGVYGGHLEYLLPRNSEFKIVETQIVDGIKIVDAEYILPKK